MIARADRAVFGVPALAGEGLRDLSCRENFGVPGRRQVPPAEAGTPNLTIDRTNGRVDSGFAGVGDIAPWTPFVLEQARACAVYCKVKVPWSAGVVPTVRRKVPDVEVDGTSSSLTVPNVESCILSNSMLPVVEVVNVPVDWLEVVESTMRKVPELAPVAPSNMMLNVPEPALVPEVIE